MLELLLFPPQAHSTAHKVSAIHSNGRRRHFLSRWNALNMRRAYWYHSFDSHSMFCYSDGMAVNWKSPESSWPKSLAQSERPVIATTVKSYLK